MTFVTLKPQFSSEICNMILKVIKKYKKQIIAVSIGAMAGFSYYYFVGCANGTCLITSNPYISTAYGSFLGFLLVGTFKKRENETA